MVFLTTAVCVCAQQTSLAKEDSWEGGDPAHISYLLIPVLLERTGHETSKKPDEALALRKHKKCNCSCLIFTSMITAVVHEPLSR